MGDQQTRVITRTWFRKFIRALLKALVVNSEAVPSPAKQLDVRFSFIEKNKNITAHDIHMQLISNQATQTVEAFAHISRDPIKEIPGTGMDTNHDKLLINNCKVEAGTGL